MKEKPGSWWKKIKQHWVAIVAIVVVTIALVAVIVAIVLAYQFDWTGFNSHTGPKLDQNQQYRPEKTLWDWLQLLFVPGVLTLGAIWFTSRQNHDREIALDNQHGAGLQAYIDNMSELLLHEKLRKSKENAEVGNIARVRTLTTLSGLDSKRKVSVLQFLYESDLINKDKRIIDLSYADLKNVNLVGFDKRGADLSGADLSGADLSEADLSETKLIGTILHGADLHKANLSGANLSGANLSGANLFGANLTGASGITIQELASQAKSLAGATMPDGTKHP